MVCKPLALLLLIDLKNNLGPTPILWPYRVGPGRQRRSTMNQKTMSEREASVAAEQAAKAHTAKDFYEQMEKANLGPLWDRFTQ